MLWLAVPTLLLKARWAAWNMMMHASPNWLLPKPQIVLPEKPKSLSVSAGSPVTNTDTAVVVASFNSTPPTLTQGTIAAALSNGTSAAVTAVQAFPGQTGTFLIEVGQPFETSIPDEAGLHQPFWQARL